MRTTQPPLPRLLTVREVAAALRISEASAYPHLASGVLPAIRVGGLLRVRADQLERLIGLEDGSAPGRDGSAPTATASRTGIARGRRHPRGAP